MVKNIIKKTVNSINLKELSINLDLRNYEHLVK